MAIGAHAIGSRPIGGTNPTVSGGGPSFNPAWVKFNHDERYMKKNVAGQKVGIQMCSATDGSAFTGAVTVSVTGDAGAQATGSVGAGACTHEGNGYHTYAPSQAETNYDLVAFTFTGSGAIPQTIQLWPSFPQTGDSFALIGSTGSGLTSLATQTSVNTIDDFLDTEIAAIKAKTDQLTFSTANRVDSQVFGMEAGTVTASAIATNAIDADALAADAVTEIQSGLATAASISALNNISSSDVSTAVWNAATASYGSAGSYGLLIETNLDAAITTRASQTSLDTVDDFLDTEIAAIKSKTDNLPADPADASDIASSFTTVNTKLDTIDDFLDTEVAAIKTQTDKMVFTTANQLDVQVLSMATDSLTAAALKADAVTEIQSGLATAAALATVDGIVDDILLDTAEIGAAGAGLTNINLPDQTMNITGNITGNLSGSVGSVTGLTVAHIDAAISTRATPAQVNAEVVDALNVDNYSEPGQGTPGASISLAAKIGYIYKAWRNRTSQTATTYSLYNDDATTVDHKATTSDDGSTFERTEVESGP